MKGIVFYLIALMIIYLTEKKYRTRKLFLYPSFLLCPVFAVIAYAGVSVVKKAEQVEGERKWKSFTKWCAVILFVFLIVLGGSRSVAEWYSSLIFGFENVDAMIIVTFSIAMLSFVIYWRIAKKLCGDDKKSIILFLILILLTYLFGYQSMASTDTIWLFDSLSITLVIRQIVVPAFLLLLLHKGTEQKLYDELTQEDEEVVSNQKGESVMKKLINVKTLTLAFVVYVLLSLFAIYTLNVKINNMSVYMQNMQESIDDLK